MTRGAEHPDLIDIQFASGFGARFEAYSTRYLDGVIQLYLQVLEALRRYDALDLPPVQSRTTRNVV